MSMATTDDKIDWINNPPHYNNHPSGIECIQITEWMNFNLGNVVKYVWRADLKGEGVYDLDKAAWYLAREISKRCGQNAKVADKTPGIK
jgi:hypothetical protein